MEGPCNGNSLSGVLPRLDSTPNAHWTPSKIQKTLTISHLILGGPLGLETEDAGLRCQCLIFDAVG